MKHHCHHYMAKLYIDPLRRHFAATVNLIFYPRQETDHLEFILHRDQQVKEIQGKQVGEYSCTGASDFPFVKDAVVWRINLRDVVPAGQPLELAFDYAGYLLEPVPWEVNRLTPEWVELGLYAPWFPWDPHSGAFTYQVDLEINPEYQVVGTGRLSGGKGKWMLSSDEPVTDITVASAPDLRQSRGCSGKASLTVHYTPGENMDGVQAILDDGLWVLDFYQNWFMDANQERHLDVVVAPRAVGGGYARPGLIMLSELSDYQASSGHRLFRWIAHEFGHLWWVGAPTDTWEDWLNESFAEYSALKVMQAKLGQQQLEQTLARMREKSVGLPAIRGISRTADEAYGVLYAKGALLLWDLEQLIGEEQMNALLRRRLQEHVISTNGFIHILSDVAGDAVAQEFDSWLGA